MALEINQSQGFDPIYDRFQKWITGSEDPKKTWKPGKVKTRVDYCQTTLQNLLTSEFSDVTKENWYNLFFADMEGLPSLGRAPSRWPKENREVINDGTLPSIVKKYARNEPITIEQYKQFRNEFFGCVKKAGVSGRPKVIFNRIVGLMYPEQFVQIPNESDLESVYDSLLKQGIVKSTNPEVNQDEDSKWFSQSSAVMSSLIRALSDKDIGNIDRADLYAYLGSFAWELNPKKDNTDSSSNDSSGNEGETNKDKNTDKGSSHEEKDPTLPFNLIYFGAPGTGKSFKLKEAVEGRKDESGKVNQNIKNDIGIFVDVKDGVINRRRYERVTFYPTYSYAQFVGCYKPVMEPKSDGTSGEEIAYKFVPGPFLRVLVDALKDHDQNHCLVIEEINRANAAAVFGDVFQLLDRATKDGEDGSVKRGESEYEIAASEDVKKFLKEKGIEKDCLRIPSNMYIWATMNSADQGVFPMDTAFKRRWDFEYVGINDDITDECRNWTIGGTKYKWNTLRAFINGILSSHGVNEDKLMGPWFVKPESGKEVSADQFASKVLMYLWEDAARMCRTKVFADVATFSELVKKWNDGDDGVSKAFKCDKETQEKIKEMMTDAGVIEEDVTTIIDKFNK